MNLLLFTNFLIFIGFFILILGLFGLRNKEEKILIGTIWLISTYAALFIVGVPVGIPFTSIYFF
ncbi:hypothetical protein [Acinetobacter baumannii]|uniref:hypothetical protein n=1 Tax=Acinetobacter baumannii TaxID=470 RepID=UPI0036F96B17